MSPRRGHHRHPRARTLPYRVAAISLLLFGGALLTANAASNHVANSNLEHIRNLPGPPPQPTTATTPVPSDSSSTSVPVSDPFPSGPLPSDPTTPPSDPAPSSTG